MCVRQAVQSWCLECSAGVLGSGLCSVGGPEGVVHVFLISFHVIQCWSLAT